MEGLSALVFVVTAAGGLLDLGVFAGGFCALAAAGMIGLAGSGASAGAGGLTGAVAFVTFGGDDGVAFIFADLAGWSGTGVGSFVIGGGA